MSLWEYGAAVHQWNVKHPDPAEAEKPGADDDGAAPPTEEQKRALRDSLRALPDVKV